MSLIENNTATEQFGVSAKNLHAILKLDENATTKEVATGVALACLEEIHRAKLGWTHAIKKFIASTLTYASVMALPFVALAGALWRCSDWFKGLSFLLEGKNALITSTATAGLLAADFAIGKMVGTRPSTLLLFGALDAYRQGAKYLSRAVWDSYTREEEKAAKEIEAHRETIKAQLKVVYVGIATELGKRFLTGTLEKEVPTTLKNKITAIASALTQIGLTKVEIKEILAPIEATIQLIANALVSAPPPAAQTQSAPSLQVPHTDVPAPQKALH